MTNKDPRVRELVLHIFEKYFPALHKTITPKSIHSRIYLNNDIDSAYSTLMNLVMNDLTWSDTTSTDIPRDIYNKLSIAYQLKTKHKHKTYRIRITT